MIVLSGEVVHGQARGRKVGMPTANLSIDGLDPTIEYGVYTCIAIVHNQRYMGVCNIGNRPTVDSKETIEVHILDFNEDIYGENISVELHEYLRPISKFDSLEAVKNQVDKDIIRTRILLSA